MTFTEWPCVSDFAEQCGIAKDAAAKILRSLESLVNKDHGFWPSALEMVACALKAGMDPVDVYLLFVSIEDEAKSRYAELATPSHVTVTFAPSDIAQVYAFMDALVTALKERG